MAVSCGDIPSSIKAPSHRPATFNGPQLFGMKTIGLLLAQVLALQGMGQVLSFGGGVGHEFVSTSRVVQSEDAFTLNATLEAKLRHGFLSFNFDPAIAFTEPNDRFLLPVYLKVFIGKDERFCPTLGFFSRSMASSGSTSYGWSVGAIFEKKIFERSFAFVKMDYYHGNDRNDNTGAVTFDPEEYISHFVWLGIGIRTYLLQ